MTRMIIITLRDSISFDVGLFALGCMALLVQ
jgi:hypothetical protein